MATQQQLIDLCYSDSDDDDMKISSMSPSVAGLPPPVPPFAAAKTPPLAAAASASSASAASLQGSSNSNNKRRRLRKDPPLPPTTSSSSVSRSNKRKRTSKAGPKTTGETPTNDDDDDDEVVEVVDAAGSGANATAAASAAKTANAAAPTLLPTPEERILEVFPDADWYNIQGLLAKFDNSVELVLQHMVEDGYEKTKSKSSSTPAATAAAAAAGAVTSMTKIHMPGLSNHQNNSKYDFLSSNSFTPTGNYIGEATERLVYDFAFLSCRGAQHVLSQYGHFHYALAHQWVMQLVQQQTTCTSKKPPQQQQQSNNNNSNQENSWDNVQRFVLNRQVLDHHLDILLKEKLPLCKPSPTVKRARKQSPTPPTITDDILKEEIEFVQTKLQDYIRRQRELVVRQQNKRQSERDGTGVECNCCFDKFPIEDMVNCRNEGHLFCTDCLQNYAEHQIFGQGNLGMNKDTKEPALELQCITGECSSGFDRPFLEKAFTKELIEKYDELQFTVTIEKAGLQLTMASCPKCQYQAEVPDGQKVFACPVAGCGFESCRECGEEAHIPLRCDEVKKDKESTEGRVAVEEAITAAKIRRCPSCKKAVIKSDGCNKIRCGCGAFFCYLCRTKIKNYSHFCQTPHCQHKSCGMCPLYANAEEVDARDMREAGYSTAESLKTDKPDGGGVEIDVEGILQSGTAAAKTSSAKKKS